MHYAFDDATQRARWSNFPTGFVARDGISLKQMSTPQQQAAMKLMGTVRSPMGLEKVNEIRQADDDFKANGSKRGPGGGAPRPPGHRRGGRADLPLSLAGAVRTVPVVRDGRPRGGDMSGSNLYFISFIETPSATKPLMLQFGGHHLAFIAERLLNVPTLVDAAVNVIAQKGIMCALNPFAASLACLPQASPACSQPGVQLGCRGLQILRKSIVFAGI